MVRIPDRGTIPAARRLDCERGASARFQIRRNLEETRDEAGVVARAVEAAKRGDRDAFRYLYVRYADNVYGYVRSIVGDDHDAEDVTQQVFTKLMTSLDRYEPRAVPFSAWMLRVARNVALDHVRQRRLILCDEVHASEADVDDRAHHSSMTVREALASLPHDQRTVLVLRHVLGLSPPEIARCLGKTEGSVHGLHHRGRGALQKALAQRGTAPSTLARRRHPAPEALPAPTA
ncbi:MAG: sigma-70 family RNA polymerase sigma factor [Thermoleophilaceae bacterium]|nr:sigma-70 family RNA polymerase sigma factor [Thermoleophilaceae bacterium]